MKYRLYIDEVGNADLGSSCENPNNRYLSLTGVILETNYDDTVVFPSLENLKNTYFRTDSNQSIILHRKELVNKREPFENLRDPVVEDCFNESLLRLLRTLDYKVITVIIDKKEHRKRYKVWHAHPYHYCLTVMLE